MVERMKRISTNDYIKERAELAGLILSDDAVAIIREKWETTDCRLDDLINGLRMLRDNCRTMRETVANGLPSCAKLRMEWNPTSPNVAPLLVSVTTLS